MRSFTQTSTELFFQLSAAGEIVALSPACRTMHGAVREQYLGHYRGCNYLACIDPDEHSLVEKSFDLLLSGVRGMELVVQLMPGEGMRILAEIKAAPWLDGERIVGVQGSLRDISGRKRRESALRQSNGRRSRQVREQVQEPQGTGEVLQHLFDTTSAGIGVLYRQKFQESNERLAQITGYTASELRSVHWRELFVEEHGRAPLDPLRLSSRTGPPQALESRWRRKDGTLVDVLFRAVSLGIAPDRSWDDKISLTVLDITARKEAERQLRAAYNELEQVFKVAIPFCLLSLDCRILKVNQAFCDFFNTGREDILGKSGQDIWGCDAEECSLSHLLAGADKANREIDRVVRGRHLVCRLHAVPYTNTSGRMSGLVVTFFDRRDEKKTAADLRNARQQLMQAEKLRVIGSLAASIAHEFNNPLCGVRSVMERMARKPELAAADQGLLELALEQCDRMKRLVRNLQQFNSPFSDARKDFELHPAIDSVLLLLNKQLEIRKAVVRKEYAAEGLRLTGVEDQIKLVLLTLIKNSGDAMTKAGGEIRILTKRDRQAVHIAVSDTGAGIGPKHLPHIFEPFLSTKTAVKETGLSLTIAQEIIKDHQGEIRVESIPDRGTTFTVILPAGNTLDTEDTS